MIAALLAILMLATLLPTMTLAANSVPNPNFNESFNRQTTALKNLGFTAPANYEINFPAALAEGVDYDYAYNSQTGDLTIVVKKGDPDHWKAALDDDLSVIIEIRADKSNYSYGYAINGNGLLAQHFQNLNTLNGNVDVQDEGDTLRADSGIPLATVNHVDDIYTIIPTEDFNQHRLLVAWADSTGRVVKREMINISVIVEEYFSIEVEAEKELEPVHFTDVDQVFSWAEGYETGWRARTTDGLIDIQTPSGALDEMPAQGTTLAEFDWKAAAPTGWTFDHYTTKREPNFQITDPVIDIFSRGQTAWDEEYIVTWVDGSGGQWQQKLVVSIYDEKPYWSRITDGTITAQMPADLFALDDWGLDPFALADKGICISYDPSLGFRVSFDPDHMPDFETLTNLWLTAPVPTGATSYSFIHQDSGRDPRAFSDQDAADTWKLLQDNHNGWSRDISDAGSRVIQAFLPEIVEIDGIRICVSASGSFRGMAVAWWNGDTLLRIDTIYGQNDDLVYKTTTDAVASLTDVVTEPIIVGEDLTNAQLECRRYPQTDSEAGTEFFQLALHGTWDPTADKTVVLPYSYFDNLTWETAKTFTEKPVIRHYDGGSYNPKTRTYDLIGTIEGEYTEEGIVFKTKTFSPFTVTIHPDAGGSSGGCYVATAVYGSYDCPEVWTLRRFRDETLAQTWYGRAFIHTYYAISPTLVKWFGDTDWFKNLWRGPLDKMVANLNAKGVADTPYDDMDW